MSSSSAADRNLLEVLAEDYTTRCRRGEQPALSEYVQRHPELEQQIRELFPTLLLLERAKIAAEPKPDAIDSARDCPRLEVLGDYRIVREIGRGGMGIVYEAEQESLGRRVALKVLPPHTSMDGIRFERFQREAKAAARLHHTNIVPVFGAGEEAGLHYIVMQYIQGHGLNEVLKEIVRQRQQGSPMGEEDSHKVATICLSVSSGQLAPLSSPTMPQTLAATEVPPGGEEFAMESLSVTGRGYWRSIARIGQQVAEALEYALGQGILHRDIKPGNLVLDAQGTVWITDFGLAKLIGSEDITHAGDLIGTIRYMAPERFSGQGDIRSDIYSLGLTLYEMAALRPAFDETDPNKLIKQVTNQDPPTLNRSVADVPRDLQTIIHKVIEREPHQRYQTAAELAEDLERFLTDRPIRARRIGIWEHLRRWCRRNPVIATLTGTVILLLALIATAATVTAFYLHDTLTESETNRLSAVERLKELKKAQREKTERLFESLLSQVDALRWSGREGQRFQSLRILKEAKQLAEQLNLSKEKFARIRNLAVACLALPDIEVAKEWDGWPAGSAGVDFTPDLKHYARGDQKGNVSIRRVADDRELARIPGTGRAVGLHFCSKGQYLALTHTNDFDPNAAVSVWTWKNGNPKRILEETRCAGWPFNFSSDSKLFACGCMDGTLAVYELPSGKRLRTMKVGRFGKHNSIWFHPTETIVGVAKQGARAEIRDLATGKLLFQPDLPTSSDRFDWHPSGKWAAISSTDQKIYLWDIKARKLLRTLVGHKNVGIYVKFTNDGNYLLSNDWHGISRLWEVCSGRQIFHTSITVWGLRFQRDGDLLAYKVHKTKLRLLRLATGKSLRTLLSKCPLLDAKPGQYQVAQCKNGVLAVTTMSDFDHFPGISILDSRTGQSLASIAVSRCYPLMCVPDGSLWTRGIPGLLRWPLRVSAEQPDVWRFGPPESLGFATGPDPMYPNHDGRVIAIGQFNGTWLLHRDLSKLSTRLFPQDDVRFTAVSPDGRWVATGSHWSRGDFAKVWDAHTGKLVKTLPIYSSCCVMFSPDNRWLATTGGGVRLWKVGSWEEGPRGTGDCPAFSNDGKLLALQDGFGKVRLLHAHTGQELTRLELPRQISFSPINFQSGDGELLLYGDRVLYIWDLRQTRKQLHVLGLDWEASPIPRANIVRDPSTKPPRKIEIIGVELARSPQKRFEFERAKYLLTLSYNPFDAETRFRLGQQLLGRGNASEAYQQANFALALRPDLVQIQFLRMLSAFQLGKYTQVAQDCTDLLKIQPENPTLLDTRAQAYQRLRKHREAVRDYTKVLLFYPKETYILVERARSYDALHEHAKASADYAAAVMVNPKDAGLLNDAAWRLVLGPVRQRNPAKALAWAQQAVTLAPKNALYRNTLGVARYRCGQIPQAVKTLHTSLALGKGTADAFDLYFLAMCYAKLNQPDKAKKHFADADRWTNRQKNLAPLHRAELRIVRREAENMLRARIQQPQQ